MVSNSNLPQIVVIDDDATIRPLIQGILGQDVEIHVSPSLKTGLSLCQQVQADIILLDHMLPDGHGLDAIPELLASDPLRPILFITAQSDAQTAIEATRRGAFDYFAKPFDFEELRQRIREALEYRKLTRIPAVVDRTTQNTEEVLVGRCRSMQEVFKAIGRLADNSQPILIEGERGTGKKLIAKTIYSFTRSESTQLVFIGSHIGAEELVEEWLHQGFQTVHGDTAPRVTVHLEDVSVLRPQQQIRLVEYHQKLAERNSLTPTIRWVFSTSKLAHELMESGVLRSDLYYLLQSGMISVPPLRSRLADLDLLVSYFIQRLTRLQSIEPGQAPPRVSASAMDLLRSYPWPGNIAELRSVIERALIQSRGAVLLSESIPILSGMDRKLGHENSSSRSNSQSSPLKAMDMTEHFGAFVQNQLRSNTQSLYEDSVRHLEAYLIPMVLEHTQGNRAAAARLLGMTRTSLRRKLQQLSISTEDTEAPGSDMDPEERP